MQVYMPVQTPTHNMITLDTVWLMLKKNTARREEKEQRKVQQCGQRFNCPRKMTIVNTLGKERQNPRPFMRIVSRLGKLHVPAGSLLE